MRLMPKRFWSARLMVPPHRHPRSAARNGSHAKSAICLRSKCRTVVRYSGSQKVNVPQVGSARNRGRAIPQKLRWVRSCRSMGGGHHSSGAAPAPKGCGVVPFRERGMRGGRMIEPEPQDHPHESKRTRQDEGRLPAVSDDGPRHERWRQHRPERCADVENASRESPLLCREPFGCCFHPRGIGRTFSEPEQPAQPEECRPTASQAMAHADDRPRRGQRVRSRT